MKRSSANINVMVKACRRAAKILIRDFGEIEKLQVSVKGPGDFVTTSDKKVETVIIEELQKARPSYSILSEEIGEINNDDSFKWIIDPIDGTANFLHGIPHFAISIGLCKNKVPILGVVYDPFKNELFCAEKGKGALLNNKRIRVSNCQKIKSAVFGTGIPYRKKDHSGVYIETLRALMDARCGSIRRLGAAALDLAYVACGRLDGFWEFNLKPWDIAAGSIIVLEAGGYISDIENNDNYFDSGNVLAANPNLHKEIIGTLKGKI